MQRDRSWKKAEYPNRRPSWQKKRLKDPLRDWNKVSGYAETKTQAIGMARGLKVFGNSVKIIQKDGYYNVYYRKRRN